MTQEAVRRVESTGRPRSEHPLATYHVILGATLLLLILGVAMVLSASTVESYRIFGSAYTLWGRQVMFAVVGLVAMVAASRMPVVFWRRMAYPTLLFALVTSSTARPFSWAIRTWVVAAIPGGTSHCATAIVGGEAALAGGAKPVVARPAAAAPMVSARAMTQPAVRPRPCRFVDCVT